MFEVSGNKSCRRRVVPCGAVNLRPACVCMYVQSNSCKQHCPNTPVPDVIT